ncbi:MAG: sulfur carrier protein ThiS [Elusimicrobia bacterium]|nr:sulfur carrier protein ThiS [Elusimicrobiota bacterium]
MTVKVFLNGKEEELDGIGSILELLNKKKIRPEVVTIEVNDKIIPRGEYGKTVLKNGDRIEMVFFMGGGRRARNNEHMSVRRARDVSAHIRIRKGAI